MKQLIAVAAGVVVLVAAFAAIGFAVGSSASRATESRIAGSSSDTGGGADADVEADKRDFLFQVTGYTTENQGGQTINLYFHYRYNRGIADADIPNYIDLRTQALKYLDGIDASKNPYWEVLDKAMCRQLKAGYPIEAISCQMQVLPDDRSGLPYEPGYHGTVYTIGDIEPLAIPGPVPAS